MAITALPSATRAGACATTYAGRPERATRGTVRPRTGRGGCSVLQRA
jgi:hypothetical protein